ncbi:MAG: TIGR03560 family F420-dependent LLM class oxidoreductase [Candidatus Limnocylindria bacterium]
MKIHLGFQLHPQHATWAELRDGALLVEELGFDSLWTWDHFVPLLGDASGPSFEGWQLLPAWGAITKRVQIGMLVTGNTYRHPAVLAKMVATLDHITAGRALLGIGAAWHEDEHRMYGIEFRGPGWRLARLAEAVPIMRSLLDEPRTTFEGKHYTITDARCEPKPVQKRLPILVGGGGEQKTLRITARWADMWHGFGTPDVIAHKIGVLRRHCAEVGRDPGEITLTTGGGVIVRKDRSAIDRRIREVRERSRVTGAYAPFSGTPDEVAKRLADHWRAGIRGFIFGCPPPVDRETIELMMSDVRPRLEALVA